MNLMKFKGADDAVKLTIRLSVGYCVILTIAFLSNTVYLSTKIEKRTAKSLLSTSTGKYMRQATYRPVICGNTNT